MDQQYVTKNGFLLSSTEVDEEFHEQLKKVKAAYPEFFSDVRDIETEFGINRSLRRRSVSRTIAQGLKEEVDVQNRWRKTEFTGGSIP